MYELDGLPKPFFILAPMDDVTDTVFRRVVAACAPPDLYFTEFVNVDGLQSPGRPRLLKKLRFQPKEQPLVAQIWGLKPENFYKTAQQIADGTFAREMGLPEELNFAGVDLNMGCPDKTVVRNGACSGLINDPDRAKEIIDSTKEGLADRLPLSVKTRVGFNEVNMDWIKFLLEQDLYMLTVHGRTKKQMSKVPANWDLIGQAREMRDAVGSKTLIVGNGDVMTKAEGLELANRHKLDGIMIGRGIFHDPFAFAEESPWDNYTAEQRIALYAQHVQLFMATWQDDERHVQTLNKFCKIYINGFEGAKEIRERLMKSSSSRELLASLSELLTVAV
jgi:tRNA-dihydrouridine synthase